jgi:hypothetical protein
MYVPGTEHPLPLPPNSPLPQHPLDPNFHPTTTDPVPIPVNIDRLLGGKITSTGIIITITEIQIIIGLHKHGITIKIM